MIRQLPVHCRADFFSHSPTEVWASVGLPVQTVTPATLGENKDDVDPSFSRIFWLYPTLRQLFPDFAYDSSEKQLMVWGQLKENP